MYMIKIPIVVALVLLMNACSVSREPNCYKRAIELSQKSVRQNVYLQYAFIDANYQGYSLVCHKQEMHRGRNYDVLILRNRENDLKKVYFYITK